MAGRWTGWIRSSTPPRAGELLPRSGIHSNPANIGYYGSVLFALFLVGWGLSMLWAAGAVRPRVPRQRVRLPYLGRTVRRRGNHVGKPVALTSIAFLIGMLLLPFGEETRGKPLPA